MYLAGFVKSRDNIAVNTGTVMNIGAFDNLCLQLLPVFDLDPEIGTLGVRTVNTFSGTEQQAVFAVVAVKTAEGNVAVFATRQQPHRGNQMPADRSAEDAL